MILKHLESAVEKVRALGYTPVYAALYGSQNYGLDVYEDGYQSDYDVKVIVMPTLYDVVFKEYKVSETVDYEGGQIDIKDAITMSRILAKMNPQYLEILLTPFYLVFPGGEYMEEIRGLLPKLLSERSPLFARAVVGLFHEKIGMTQKITPSSKEKIEKYGYDGKHLHHALRLKLMLEDFEKSGRMALRPPCSHIGYLLSLKKNEIPLREVADLSRKWCDEVAACTTRLAGLNNICDDAADYALDITKQAVYMALKADAMGAQAAGDTRKGKTE